MSLMLADLRVEEVEAGLANGEHALAQHKVVVHAEVAHPAAGAPIGEHARVAQSAVTCKQPHLVEHFWHGNLYTLSGYFYSDITRFI